MTPATNSGSQKLRSSKADSESQMLQIVSILINFVDIQGHISLQKQIQNCINDQVCLSNVVSFDDSSMP